MGAIIAFSRCLFYTLCATFTGSLFGFDTFGQIYGLVFLMAGIANLAVHPLSELAHTHGFNATNGGISLVQVTTVLLPWWIYKQHLLSKSRRQQPARTVEETVLRTMGDRGRVCSTHDLEC